MFKIRCLFGKHRREYWSEEKCKKENVFMGCFKPYKCKDCGFESQVFYRSPYPNPLVNGVKTTSQLLQWARELELSEKQEEEIIRYIGNLEVLLRNKSQIIQTIQRAVEKDS